MRPSPPDLPGATTTDSPIDRALTLLLADEVEAALRWSAAVVESDPSIPSGLVITCRLLKQLGRPEASPSEKSLSETSLSEKSLSEKSLGEKSLG